MIIKSMLKLILLMAAPLTIASNCLTLHTEAYRLSNPNLDTEMGQV